MVFVVSRCVLKLNSAAIWLGVVIIGERQGKIKYYKFLYCKSRVHRHWKKIYRVDFFAKANSGGLTNYVIRHNSK